MITIYAQGMHMLKIASDKMKYNITLKDVARIWRGGCIIRSSMLEQIMQAYQRNSSLTNLITDNFFAAELSKRRDGIVQVIEFAMRMQVPVPVLSGALAYVDAYRSQWLPANLIQAQRDFFGSHTYQRTDKEGTFHTKWE